MELQHFFQKLSKRKACTISHTNLSIHYKTLNQKAVGQFEKLICGSRRENVSATVFRRMQHLWRIYRCSLSRFGGRRYFLLRYTVFSSLCEALVFFVISVVYSISVLTFREVNENHHVNISCKIARR